MVDDGAVHMQGGTTMSAQDLEQEQEHRKTFGTKLPEDLITAVRERAEEENVPIRDLVERMLRCYLREHPSRQGRLL